MPQFGEHYYGMDAGNKPRGEAFTEKEFNGIQETLNRRLGPEWIQVREGPSKSRVCYLSTHTAIDLANHIFGFNGWSSSIKDVTVDFVDIDNTGKVSVGISVTCRITLKDGAFREDMGYGESKGRGSKASAFDMARKVAASDALKRTLRLFGNALGNCLYDNTYVDAFKKMPRPKVKLDTKQLLRHPDLRLPPPPTLSNGIALKNESPVKRQTTTDSGVSIAADNGEFEADGFDDLAFLTEEDLCMLNGLMPDASDSEVPNHEPLQITAAQSLSNSDRNSSDNTVYTKAVESLPGKSDSLHANKPPLTGHTSHAPDRGLSAATSATGRPGQAAVTAKPQNSAMGPIATNESTSNVQRTTNGTNTSLHASIYAPNRQSLPPRHSGPQDGHMAKHQSPRPNHPPSNTVNHNRPPPQQGHNPQLGNVPRIEPEFRPNGQNQNTRAPTNAVHQPPNQPNQPNQQTPQNPQNPTGQVPAVFYNARAVDHLSLGNDEVPSNMAFDHRAPFKGKGITEGVSHSTSAPINRELVGQNTSNANGKRPNAAVLPRQVGSRPNFVNPQADINRKIGMPNHGAQSPMANRNSYKPPGPAPNVSGAGMKRTADHLNGRPPLAEVSNGQLQNAAEEQGAKKQRLADGTGITAKPVEGPGSGTRINSHARS